MRFFRDAVKTFPMHFAGRVLDIGSLDINGGPHTLFDCQEYFGVDLAPGPNVTHVERGQDLTLPSGHFDVAMSSECFEHNPEWRATLANMIRMTRDGGIVVVTAASTGRPEHGTTRSDGGLAAPLAVAAGQEWYRNLTAGQVRREVAAAGLDPYLCVTLRDTSDLLLLGLKGPADPADGERVWSIMSRWTTIARSTRFPGGRIRRAILASTGDRGLKFAQKAEALLPRQGVASLGRSRAPRT